MTIAAAQSTLIEATVALVEIENSVMKTEDDTLLQKLDALWSEALSNVRSLMERMGVREVPRAAATALILERAAERKRIIDDKKARKARDAEIARALLAL